MLVTIGLCKGVGVGVDERLGRVIDAELIGERLPKRLEVREQRGPSTEGRDSRERLVSFKSVVAQELEQNLWRKIGGQRARQISRG